jgi:hypothetical protein
VAMNFDLDNQILAIFPAAEGFQGVVGIFQLIIIMDNFDRLKFVSSVVKEK